MDLGVVMADLGAGGIAYAVQTDRGIACVLSPAVSSSVGVAGAARALMAQMGVTCGEWPVCAVCPLGGG